MEHRSYRTGARLSPLSDTISVLPLGCGRVLCFADLRCQSLRPTLPRGQTAIWSASLSREIRNSLKADEGWNGKSGILLAHPRVKPLRPDAGSPANTDKLKRLHAAPARMSHGAIAHARHCGTVKVLDALNGSCDLARLRISGQAACS